MLLPKYEHKVKIIKGKLGEFSKIEEEFWECKDAHEQDNFFFELVELSDLLGAIMIYTFKKYHIWSPLIFVLSFLKTIRKLFGVK